MAKTGRNDPCPCGSGQKYKRCCLPRDEAAAVERARALEREQALLAPDEQDDGLDEASNSVIDLIDAGRLDEAEQAAQDLLTRYPEVHDGYDRLGMVHEARGQFREAADCYRKVIEFTHANPQEYDAGFVDSFLERIAKLEASATEAERVNDADRFG